MFRHELVIASLFCGLLFPGSGRAGPCKRIDADGGVRYGDNPPENADLKRFRGNLGSFSPVGVGSSNSTKTC